MPANYTVNSLSIIFAGGDLQMLAPYRILDGDSVPASDGLYTVPQSTMVSALGTDWSTFNTKVQSLMDMTQTTPSIIFIVCYSPGNGMVAPLNAVYVGNSGIVRYSDSDLSGLGVDPSMMWNWLTTIIAA